MKEARSNEASIEFKILKFSGIAFIALTMLMNIVGAAPPENITFVTTGSSFSPIITVTGNPTIQWTFGDGSTSNSASPNVNFGSAGTRTNTLVVTPWSAVSKINIGYDGSDDGVTPSPDTIAYLKQQNVVAVSGLENVAPYLQIWASSENPITELNFNNFTALHTIECFYCTELNSIELHNVSSLNRMCLEHCNISYLDLSEAPSLADIRASSQGSSTYTVNWGSTGANIWHICIRDNPQIKSTFPLSQFPLLRDLYNWNDNQSGILDIHAKSLKTVLSANNHYSVANFSGCFPENRSCELNLYNNNLKSLDISDDPGLLYLNASLNSLNKTAVDGILQTLDSYNTTGGSLDLTGNAAPSLTGLAYVENLKTKNWQVKIPSQNNPPIANFTSNVTFGTVPLAVQFSDTSSDNSETWSWDFGDGTYSTEKSPDHLYTSSGNYTVTLAVRNSNSADFKDIMITILKKESSESNNGIDNHISGDNSNSSDNSYSSGSGGSSHKSSGSSGSSKSGGGGGAGGSPEPQSNVEVKELSQAYVSSSQTANFTFPKKATCVEYVCFDSKKTLGKTTTIAEMLKGKSNLVSQLPEGEVYKSINVWVGSGGVGTAKNIENAVICFKVDKAWIKDNKIDKDSIVLNRYATANKKWEQLPTTLLNEDEKYLYFTAKTQEFGSFVITGKQFGKENEGTLPNKQTNSENKAGDQNNSSKPVATEKNSEEQSEPKGNTKMPAFELSYGIVGLLAVFLYKKR